ncbi:MAG: hypothetical protein GXO48_01210 [Chlorobi bacterium]|nr:hypothetical protein [Chlorobiota bacterium]
MIPGSLLDLFLGFLYAIVLTILFLFIAIRLKDPPGNWKILMIGFSAHVISAITFVVFMSTYYGYLGDALFYFNTTAILFKNLISKPYLAFELLFSDLENINPLEKLRLFGTTDSEVITMARLTLPFYILGMGMFTPTGVLISILPFTGKFFLLKALRKAVPSATMSILNKVSLAVFLLPTALFWGTSILKESFIMFAVGTLFLSLQMLGRGNFLLAIPLIAIAYSVIAGLKAWVLYVFLGSLSISLTIYTLNIPRIKQDALLRSATLLIFLIIGGLIGYLGAKEVLKEMIDNLLQVAYGFQTWHTYLGQKYGQSSYTLLTIPDLLYARWWQFLLAFPEALFTALYRPFLFEIDRLSEALVLPENLFLLILSIKVIGRFKRVWINLRKSPVLLSSFIFGILSLYIVGLVSFNFGAMVRYRIPGLIPLIATLLLIYLVVSKSSQQNINS